MPDSYEGGVWTTVRLRLDVVLVVIADGPTSYF
jgi:hypothetical protein